MDAAVVWEAARALRDVDDKVREADVDDANDAWLMSGRVRPARRTRRA